MTVRYKSATVDEFIENHSHDISRGGIFIKTRSPFPAGTLLKFEVRIAEDQKLMHGVGRVVWRREADRAEESFPAGMGIKFIKTGEGASDLINQLIAAREGVESSFDAGVRENVSTPNGSRHSAIPTAPAPAAAKSTTAPPTSAPSLSVESGPRAAVVPTEAETAVTNPAKKRQDQAPDKRKVVLQGPALESPSSKSKPGAVTARPAGDSAPSRSHSRGSIAEETTSPRARHATKKSENESPKLGGLIVILALVGLVVFVVNRLRGPGAEPSPTTVSAEPPPASPPAALPPPPAPEPPPAAHAAPAEADPADPNGAGVEVPAGAQPAPTGAAPDPAVAAPTIPPAGTSPAPECSALAALICRRCPKAAERSAASSGYRDPTPDHSASGSEGPACVSTLGASSRSESHGSRACSCSTRARAAQTSSDRAQTARRAARPSRSQAGRARAEAARTEWQRRRNRWDGPLGEEARSPRPTRTAGTHSNADGPGRR